MVVINMGNWIYIEKWDFFVFPLKIHTFLKGISRRIYRGIVKKKKNEPFHRKESHGLGE